MGLACYFPICNHFFLKTKIIPAGPVDSVSWMLFRCCSLCFFTLHRPAYVCDGCITLVKDCECSNEKLKQNQSTVLDSYARVIKLVIYFAL